MNPVTFGQFGGLNLADDPEDVGPNGAVDLDEVDVDQSGRIRSRPGFSSSIVSVTATSTDGLAAFETTAGLKQFVLAYTNGATKRYAAYSSTGGAAVATATPALTRMSAVRFAAPGSEYLYIGNGSDTIWRWTGAAFSQPAGMPAGQYLAVDANSNRLVTAVTANGGSSIEWSDPGLPETWTASNTLQLAPGDGSFIEGLASWQDYVFAFKRRRFAVFTGESTDGDGLPIFNYHTIDGYGAIVPPVAGDEGVYFFDGRTIWLTTGGTPTRVSRPVEPFLRGETNIGSGLVAADQANLVSFRLFYSLGRLYVKVITTGAGTGFTTLVFDPKVNAWTVYSVGAEWIETLRTAGTDRQFTHFAANGSVYKFDSSLTVDGIGSPIQWSWTSGATDLGFPGRTKVTLESRLWGTGTVQLGVANDYGSFDNPASVVLGTAPTIADGWDSSGREGTLWQHRFIGSSAGSVSRVAHYVSFVKPAGIE